MRRPALLVLSLLVLAGCDSGGDPDGGVSSDAMLTDAGPAVDSGDDPTPDAGPGPGTLSVEVAGLPAGADAWIAVTSLGAESWWIRETTTIDAGRGEVVIAAAPVEVDGTAYAPDPTEVRADLSTAPGDVTVTYAPAPTDYYDTEPDFASCGAGYPTEATQVRALAMLRFIRALVGLPPVGYGPEDEAMMAETAVVYANNGSPNPHEPPSDATCFTSLAFDGAAVANLRWVGSSNLANVLDDTPESMVRFWGGDRDVRSLGHRRWLLDPFLPEVSFGMAYGPAQPGPYARPYDYIAAAAMRVIYPSDQQADLSGWDTPDFVAYPVGDFPAALIEEEWPYLSFQIVADATTRWGANQDEVDLSSATVEITDASGAVVDIADPDANTRGIGLPNQLSWRSDGLVVGETYSVSITGAQVSGAPRDYAYEFTLR